MNDCQDVRNGMRVRVAELGETGGMLIATKHLLCRRKGATGTVNGYVPGHGGDVWWVKHDDSDDIGAYCFTEFEGVTT